MGTRLAWERGDLAGELDGCDDDSVVGEGGVEMDDGDEVNSGPDK